MALLEDRRTQLGAIGERFRSVWRIIAGLGFLNRTKAQYSSCSLFSHSGEYFATHSDVRQWESYSDVARRERLIFKQRDFLR